MGGQPVVPVTPFLLCRLASPVDMLVNARTPLEEHREVEHVEVVHPVGILAEEGTYRRRPPGDQRGLDHHVRRVALCRRKGRCASQSGAEHQVRRVGEPSRRDAPPQEEGAFCQQAPGIGNHREEPEDLPMGDGHGEDKMPGTDGTLHLCHRSRGCSPRMDTPLEQSFEVKSCPVCLWDTECLEIH